MQTSMSKWEISIFGSVRKELGHLRCELEDVRRQPLFTGPSQHEKRIMARISELLAREETMEKQRSWITWLKEGDRNTKIFQAKAREQAKTNQIAELRSAEGVMITEQRDLEHMVVEFYMDLFMVQEESFPEEILVHVSQRVTDEMNASLTPLLLLRKLNVPYS